MIRLVSPSSLIPYVGALRSEGPVTSILPPHSTVHPIHTGWLQAKAMPSPTLPMEIKVDRAAYAELNLTAPSTFLISGKTKSCADTIAQLFTVPTSNLSPLGMEEDFLQVATKLNTVTGSPVDIIGGSRCIFGSGIETFCLNTVILTNSKHMQFYPDLNEGVIMKTFKREILNDT